MRKDVRGGASGGDDVVDDVVADVLGVANTPNSRRRVMHVVIRSSVEPDNERDRDTLSRRICREHGQ